ncbi:MAG: hypothetical protein AAF252_09545 [Pseudomonadota bacterium]
MRAGDAAEIYAQRPDQNAFSLYRDLAAVGPRHLWFEIARPATSMDPVALFGVAGLSPGVGVAHMFGTDDLTLDHCRQIADRIRTVVVPAMLDLGLHRVHADSLASYHWAHRFLQRAGARFEGPCWNLGRNGEDFATFVWLRSDLGEMSPPKIVKTDQPELV